MIWTLLAFMSTFHITIRYNYQPTFLAIKRRRYNRGVLLLFTLRTIFIHLKYVAVLGSPPGLAERGPEELEGQHHVQVGLRRLQGKVSGYCFPSYQPDWCLVMPIIASVILSRIQNAAACRWQRRIWELSCHINGHTYLNDVCTERGEGVTQMQTQEGRLRDFTTMDLARMQTRGEGGPKSQKLCRHHLSMTP